MGTDTEHRAGGGALPGALLLLLLRAIITVLLPVLVLLTATAPGWASSPVRHVSQCFATKGNPFVSMQCGRGGHLAVRSALHGRHSENRSECVALKDDCVEDQMRSFYDWQDCMGRSRCVQSVQQSWMPSCGNYSQFLQADYTCVNGDQLINMCKKKTYHMEEGYLRSPDYPDHYPHSRDCECTLTPSGTDHLFVAFLDLALEMKKETECADWLLLEAGTGSGKLTDLNCGEVVQNTKNVTVKGSPFHFHFHSDRNDNRSQAFRFNTRRKLKGFWVYFRAEPIANITMTCGPTKPKVLIKLRPSPTRKPSYGDYYLEGAASRPGTSIVIITAMTSLAAIMTSLVLLS